MQLFYVYIFIYMYSWLPKLDEIYNVGGTWSWFIYTPQVLC